MKREKTKNQEMTGRDKPEVSRGRFEHSFENLLVSYCLLRMPLLNQDRKMYLHARLTMLVAVLDVHTRGDDHDDATSSCARKHTRSNRYCLPEQVFFRLWIPLIRAINAL